MKRFLCYRVLFLMGLLVCTLTSSAQFLRTSYFMEGSHYRMQLNPALAPGRGYINIPVIGSFNASVNSSSLGYQDVIDILDNSSDADFFMNDKFINRLSDKNSLNLNLNTDILSAGWYKGKNFWSFNVGLHVNVGASLPKSMFQLMRDMNGADLENIDWSNYHQNVGQEKLAINSYAEVGLGYARTVNKRLTVGGRLKALLGVGDMTLQINKLAVNTNLNGLDPKALDNIDWSQAAVDESYRNNLASSINGTGEVVVDASLESSFKGLELHEGENGYIDEFKFESKDMGVAGYGAAIDLGASYKVLDRLTVSAAVIDLGFIKWSKSSSTSATAKSSDDLSFDFNQGGNLQKKIEEVQRFADLVSNGEVLNYDMLQLTQEETGTKARTTSLASTVVLGAEYELTRSIAVGALYTSRFTKPENINELTLSANIRPKNYFNLSVSYSMLQSAGKSFGLGLKLGPVFLGTDYMFLGKNSRSVSGFLGVSIPLNKQKAI